MDKCKVCGKLTDNKCSGCNLVFYCSREHQISDWKARHKNDCKCYEIKQNEKLGRFTIAKRDIKAGEIVLREKNVLIAPKVLSRVVCLGCHKLITPLTKSSEFYECSRCTWPLCGVDCEKSSFHVDECKKMHERKFKSSIKFTGDYTKVEPTYCLIAPLRVILLKEKHPKNFKIVMELVSHLNQKIHSKLYSALKLNLVPFIRDFLELELTEREILNIAGILDTNAFEVFVPSKKVRARGIYPMTAMMAHDCIPNTKHFVDSNLEMRVLAVKDIKKGEMILTSYSHPLSTTIERRLKLKEAKCFDCNCARCSDATEFGTFASSINCFKCGDGKLISMNPLDNQAEWHCVECKTTFPFSQIFSVIKRARTELGELNKTSAEECEKFLREFSRILPASSVFLIDVKYSLCLLFGNNEKFPIQSLSLAHLERKIELCHELLMVFDIIEPGMSNSIANVNFELSLAKIARFKIKRILENNPQAFHVETEDEMKKIRSAYEILMAGSEYKSSIENRMKIAVEISQ